MSATAPLAKPFVEYVEQYRCPRCDSALPSACVQGNTFTSPSDGRMHRGVRVYCDHCDALFSAMFLISDGRLLIESGPTLVTAPLERERFMRRLRLLRGDREV